MKTADEILFELKEWLKRQMDYLEGCHGRDEAEREGYMYTLGKIQELEAEQRKMPEMCFDCAGTGEVHGYDQGEPIEAECLACSGTGKILQNKNR